MPFIIITTTRGPEGSLSPYGTATKHITRTAVATLDEARDHVASLGAGYGAMAHLDCVLDGTSRMPIGPLPDGTVIEVRPVTWERVTHDTPGIEVWHLVTDPAPFVADQIVAAYNAVQR